MREEIETLWQAMKSSHYQRTIENLAQSVRNKNLNEALQTSLETVVSTIHAETGTLWFYDRFETDRIFPRAVCGGEALEGVSLAPGEGIAGKVIERGKAVIIKNCQEDSRWAGRVDEKTGFKTHSMICVPLVIGDISFGSIQIINNRNGQLFDEKDLSITEQLATEIALLLKNEGLLDEYLKNSSVPKPVADFSFRELFIEGSSRDMERKLHGFTEFASLSYRKQQDVIQLCKKLHQCFEKTRG